MAKKMIYNLAARTALKSGIDQLADAVKVTLGPKGKNVILFRPNGSMNVTKDGVSVAKEISLKDAFENIGANLVKEAASKTCDVAGDGTTSSTVLAQAIVNEGMKNVVEKFISFINVDYSSDELEKMYERLTKHSKNANAVFEGDSFKEEVLQIDFTKVDALHEKLSPSFAIYEDQHTHGCWRNGVCGLGGLLRLGG